ncbi:MAG: SDR family NAD(P)-dependent oxidoreductase, partial [Kineosporiaceae bacterium]
AGRDPARLELVGKEFAGRPAAGRAAPAGGPGLPVPAVEVVAVDAVATDTHAQIVDAVFDAGDIDVTVLAVGHLGDQVAMQAEPALAVRAAEANFVGPLSLMLHVGRRLRAQGHGVLVVLSSVAGRQARPANFVYGAGKAGLDLAALGLGDSLTASGARVVVVRPGFVRTRMTAHLPTPPLAVGPDDVARAVVDGIHRRRTVVYSPPAARLLSWGLTLAPRAVLRRLPF